MQASRHTKTHVNKCILFIIPKLSILAVSVEDRAIATYIDTQTQTHT